MQKILVVEDEQDIREVESAYLSRAGFTIVEAKDGKEALNHLTQDENISLIVLDINLPYINGIEICKKVRKESMVPIIMVTAKTEEIDELLGLDVGADDYIKKPFSPNVLVARVQSLLRRFGDKQINTNGLSIDPEKMKVTLNDKLINLTNTEFNILYVLAGSPGKVFTRAQLLDTGYNQTLPPEILDRTIDAHIKNIRKKLDLYSKKDFIQTVIGKGYKFIE